MNENFENQHSYKYNTAKAFVEEPIDSTSPSFQYYQRTSIIDTLANGVVHRASHVGHHAKGPHGRSADSKYADLLP